MSAMSPSENWFGFSPAPAAAAAPAPADTFAFDTTFEAPEPDAYSATQTTSVQFNAGPPRTSAPGALYGFGYWTMIIDAGRTDNQVMQVINNGVVDATPAHARTGSQSVRVDAAGIGAQSAGYGDDWDAINVAGHSVSLSIDVRVTAPNSVKPGFWGLTLLSSADADGFIRSFGGIGLINGQIYLSLDGSTASGASLGSVAYGDWVTLGLEFNFQTHTLDALVNGSVAAANVAFDPADTGDIAGFGTFGQGSSDGTTETANFDNYSITLVGTAVPEPGSAVMAGAGLLVLGLSRRRDRRVVTVGGR